MASAFAHAAAGAALWPLFRTPRASQYTWIAGGALATLPDLDVIGFRFGVPYGSLFGHRGLTHSLVVAVVVGGTLAWMISRRWDARRDQLLLASYLILALASHGLLDAMTTGGMGVALFAPFDDGRYFFPWRPIAVSPIGLRPFFTRRGLRILANEAAWVGVPSLLLALLGIGLRKPNGDEARAASETGNDVLDLD